MRNDIVEFLIENGAIEPDSKPLQSNDNDLRQGVRIIDVPPTIRPDSSDFIVYDCVTHLEGKVLTQIMGHAYHVQIRDGEIFYVEVENIKSSKCFGHISRYQNNYFITNEEFVESLRNWGRD